MRPTDLAREVGVSGVRMNRLLNGLFPRSPADRGQPWSLTSEQAAAVRAYYSGLRSRAASDMSEPEVASLNRTSGQSAPPNLPGDSAEQHLAEIHMLDAAGHVLGVKLRSRRFSLANGTKVEVDGFSESPPTLVEAWAHQGVPKPAQKAKVTNDAFKLLWIERRFFPQVAVRKALVLSDELAAAHFRGGGRAASALETFGVHVIVVDLPDHIRRGVMEAQRRQGQDFRKRRT
jgi:hypothetical protein